MITSRTALRTLLSSLALAFPLLASAATFDVKALIDVDNNRGTGCNVTTVGGIVSGIDTILTTSGSVTGGVGTVTGVTRQTCAGGVFSAPVAVDSGWNVGVSPSGDLTIETHLGTDVITWDNVGTPRFVFTATSGLSSDAQLSPWSWGGGDIVLTHAARDRAVSTGLRAITLNGDSLDWAGVPPLANGTETSPVWRFISSSVFASRHDLFFNIQIHTNIGAPTAHDDNYALTTLGSTLTVATLGVLNNDNPNGQPITAVLVDSPQHGTLTLNANGGFTYTHDGSLAQQDQFHYIAQGTLPSNIATVTIDLPGSHPYTFTSPDHTTFTEGVPNTFVVTVTGKPTPALTVVGDFPAGITFTDNGDGTGTLAGTPGANTVGTYAMVFTADKNKPHHTSQNFTLTVVCGGVTVTNPVISTGTAGTAFSQTFTQSGGVGTVTFSLNTGVLPSGLTLSAGGVLSGTPTQSGSFPITVKATDASGCAGISPTYNLVIACHTVTVTNPATSTGTANIAFSQTFTQSGAISGATFSLNSGTLPTGLTLSAAGVLSGTPTQTGSFPITVKVIDGQGCGGVGPTYTLVIGCQTITVTNPATTTGTASSAFSQTFTASNTIGATTFTTASTLPAGLTLSAAGVLSGTPTQTGAFPIVVKATDANGCFGNGATYTLTIACQTITVTNPASGAGTVSAAFNKTFTQSNAIGATTFSLNSGTLPAGLTLAANGTLSGTPTQTGSFPITVKVTDANGCTGIGATYTIVIACQTITVTNPATTSGTVNAAFSQNFTQSGAVGGSTFSLNSGTLPSGFTLAANGTLSGTTTQFGSFPITVKVTDGNGCTGIGATYNLVINCQVITVTNPATTTGVAGTAFSQTFTQSNAAGTATFSINSGTLPAGLTLSAAGLLSGTPTQTGPFPITVLVTDSNGCTGIGASYNLVINCQTITVSNPGTTTGTAGAAFSQTFTQTGAIGGATFTTASTLPTGLTLSAAGVLSGTPTQTGPFPIVVTVTDGNGCTGTGATYNLVINCQTITVTNPGTTTGTAGTPFSQSFSQSAAIGGATFSLNSGSLPTGLTLSTAGVLSGTPTVVGNFPITVKVTDGNGCTGIGATYTLVIGCQTITVTNPGTTTGTVDAAFTQTFTQSGAIGGATFSLNSGSLPAGLTLSAAGLLSGTPTVNGSFPITVKVTDGNGCTGVSASYNLVINCQTITVTNPGVNTGTVAVPFSQTFTQTGAHGTATFTTASTLPSGFSLSTAGVLSGTTNQHQSFPIVVTVTDSNGCTGTSATYTLIISCQTITVSNPSSSSIAAGTLLPPANFTFTQSGSIGGATFTTASTLPTGVSLTTAGVLTGTPTQGGSFPIVVTVTDGNGCTGVSSGYTLTVTCPTITVTNPGINSGTAGVAFSQTFTQAGGQGTITWSETGALPAGITLNSATGALAGTTNAVGSFPITVTATDQNGCTGTGATYTLTINCQTITVTNPGVNTGTVDAAFSQTFTKTGILGTVTWSETGALPAGITLNSATGVLAGTPTVTGSFPITVTATDTNGCSGSSPYTLTINCQTITVTNPGVTTGTVDAPFSQTFTQTAAHGTATFTTASALPAGLSLSTAGVLSGTPTVKGPFSIVVTVTDSNGCTGTGATYNLTINCQTITVTNPGVTTGTAGTPFSQNFSQSGAHVSATFTTASTLPTGFSLSTAGVLSGTTTQHGSFPIVVTVTDANGCTGTSATYSLVIACNAISVTNPVNTAGTVAAAFSETFTQSGSLGTPSFTTASTLPTGLTLHSATGILDGTPTQSGSFPIVVTVTDSNGCTGTGATYTLVIGCNVITVTNPGVNSGTAGVVFSQTFTQSGGNGTIVWSETGALPAGIILNSSTGTLAGTTSQTGSFPITVKATDANLCFGTSNYTLTINCQTITVTNPAVTTTQAGVAFDQAFTATGILGTATWSETGALPSGITIDASTGHLAGTTTAIGSYPITVTATDTNGCSGTGATYTLTVTCPTITVTRNGGGSFPAGIFNTAYSGQSVTAAPASTYTFAVTLGAMPTGLSLSSAGAISGTPTATGNFTFTVTATDTVSLCTGSQSFSIAIAPVAVGDSYPAASHLVDNTQFVITGGTTVSPATPFVGSLTTLIANDLPSGGVTATPGTVATTGGGSVTIAADGTFIYTPGVHAAAITSDTFTYTVVSNGVTSAPATVTLTLANRVWFVKNNGAAGNGQSQSPFNTLAAAQTASAAGDTIFVYNGNGTTSGQTTGITLKSSQKLIGEGVALVVNTVTLVPAGTKPQISNTTAASDAVTLNDGNTVSGLTITAATRDGISSLSLHSGFTADSLIVQNNGNIGIELGSMIGTATITNSTISGNTVGGFLAGNGTVTVNMDSTNTISAAACTFAVSIQNRNGGAGPVNIGATLNGGGIAVNSNTVGTISFTGTQTLSNTTCAAVNLVTNAGATINFSGTLNITTTTGIGFNATGGGTLNVSGTANITSGAAANALNLNGMTVGGTGVDFDTVTATGATTAIALTNVTGLVTVNGGTITNGTTGISLQGATTSLTLAGVTITGPTTGITNTTNFGTLTIGASVNVSAVTALNLTTGNLNGTFANLSSTGGTNGVSLTSIGGTGWTATTGTLANATGAGFFVSGGSANMTYSGNINTTTAAAHLVDITGRTGGTILFSTGTLGGGATAAGAGIRIQNSTGNSTFTFSGTQTLGTSVSRMASTAVTLAGNNTNTNFNFSGTMSIFTTGVTAFTATGPTGGTINFSGTDGIDAAAGQGLVLNGMALSAGTLSGVTSTGGVNGIALTTVTGGTLTITGGSLSGATGAAFLVSGGSVSVTDNGTISQATAAQPAVNVINGHSGTLTFGGNVTATNGTGLQFNNADGTYSFNGTTNSLTGGAGVDIVAGSSGTFTFSAGTSITNATTATADFNVDSSNGNVTYNGTISDTTGKSLVVNGCGGGTKAFTGTIGSSGGTGISLTSNAGTIINISGNMTLSTGASAAFTATGGGTVTATNTSSTAVTTTGTAVNIANTTIGAGGVKFLSVSSNGAANGILLNTTGAGGFTVIGDGGGANNGSGGTIQATTAEGILLTSAANVSIGYMNITNFGSDGISATSVNGITINRCNISDNAGNVTIDDGITLINTSGAIAITSDVITTARHQGITVDNFNVNMASFTLTGSTVTGTPGGDGVLIQMRGTSVMTTGAIGGNTAALGNTFSSNSATGLQIANADTGNIVSMNIQNNTVSGNNAGMDLDLSQSASYNVTVQNNTYTNQATTALNLVQSTSATGGSLTALIKNNNIGTAGVFDSGSKIGSGIRVANGGTTINLTLDTNVIREVPNGRGIDIEPQAYILDSNVKLKVVNNTVVRPSGTNANIGCGAGVPCPSASLFVLSDNNAMGGFEHVCMSISGNTFYDPTSWPLGGEAAFYFARRTGASNTMNLEGTQANVTAQILSNNTVTNFTSVNVVDEGAPGLAVAIVAAGTCGSFP